MSAVVRFVIDRAGLDRDVARLRAYMQQMRETQARLQATATLAAQRTAALGRALGGSRGR